MEEREVREMKILCHNCGYLQVYEEGERYVCYCRSPKLHVHNTKTGDCKPYEEVKWSGARSAQAR